MVHPTMVVDILRRGMPSVAVMTLVKDDLLNAERRAALVRHLGTDHLLALLQHASHGKSTSLAAVSSTLFEALIEEMCLPAGNIDELTIAERIVLNPFSIQVAVKCDGLAQKLALHICLHSLRLQECDEGNMGHEIIAGLLTAVETGDAPTLFLQKLIFSMPPDVRTHAVQGILVLLERLPFSQVNLISTSCFRCLERQPPASPAAHIAASILTFLVPRMSAVEESYLSTSAMALLHLLHITVACTLPADSTVRPTSARPLSSRPTSAARGQTSCRLTTTQIEAAPEVARPLAVAFSYLCQHWQRPDLPTILQHSLFTTLLAVPDEVRCWDAIAVVLSLALLEIARRYWCNQPFCHAVEVRHETAATMEYVACVVKFASSFVERDSHSVPLFGSTCLVQRLASLTALIVTHYFTSTFVFASETEAIVVMQRANTSPLFASLPTMLPVWWRVICQSLISGAANEDWDGCRVAAGAARWCATVVVAASDLLLEPSTVYASSMPHLPPLMLFNDVVTDDARSVCMSIASVLEAVDYDQDAIDAMQLLMHCIDIDDAEGARAVLVPMLRLPFSMTKKIATRADRETHDPAQMERVHESWLWSTPASIVDGSVRFSGAVKTCLVMQQLNICLNVAGDVFSALYRSYPPAWRCAMIAWSMDKAHGEALLGDSLRDEMLEDVTNLLVGESSMPALFALSTALHNSDRALTHRWVSRHGTSTIKQLLLLPSKVRAGVLLDILPFVPYQRFPPSLWRTVVETVGSHSYANPNAVTECLTLLFLAAFPRLSKNSSTWKSAVAESGMHVATLLPVIVRLPVDRTVYGNLVRSVSAICDGDAVWVMCHGLLPLIGVQWFESWTGVHVSNPAPFCDEARARAASTMIVFATGSRSTEIEERIMEVALHALFHNLSVASLSQLFTAEHGPLMVQHFRPHIDIMRTARANDPSTPFPYDDDELRLMCAVKTLLDYWSESDLAQLVLASGRSLMIEALCEAGLLPLFRTLQVISLHREMIPEDSRVRLICCCLRNAIVRFVRNEEAPPLFLEFRKMATLDASAWRAAVVSLVTIEAHRLVHAVVSTGVLHQAECGRCPEWLEQCRFHFHRLVSPHAMPRDIEAQPWWRVRRVLLLPLFA